MGRSFTTEPSFDTRSGFDTTRSGNTNTLSGNYGAGETVADTVASSVLDDEDRTISKSRSSGKVGGDGWSYSKDEEGNWIARPYKKEALDKAMTTTVPGTERRDAILSNLKAMGVTAFIIDAQHAKSTSDVMEHVHRVIGFVSKENRSFGTNTFQRCLLFQDNDGLLYNLVLPQNFAGQAHAWEANVDSFSAYQSIVALTCLVRSLPCLQEDKIDEQLKPAILAVILGLVLYEEISMSCLNSIMMVCACPSVSAYSLTHRISTDWPRKLVILALALGGAATGKPQVWLTGIGLSLGIIVLLANLGSRVWYFFNWQPITYDGPMASLYAYAAAVATGFALPFMSSRISAVGDKPAVESIIRCAIGLALTYIITDVDPIRSFIIVGAEDGHKAGITIFFAIWIALTLIVCVWMVAKVDSVDDNPEEEPLLIEDHLSPVNYKVPSLPDYPIDPALAETSMCFISLKGGIFVGVLIVGILVGGIISTVFTSWDEAVTEELEGTIFRI